MNVVALFCPVDAFCQAFEGAWDALWINTPAVQWQYWS